MKLRGISFHPVLDASGARNFDGSGWWYHHYLKPFGLDFSRSTFVAKTTTIRARKGNMDLQSDGLTPQKKFPDCVVVNFRKAAVLNAVGLSGPGAKALFEMGFWQKWNEPFFLSFMPVESSLESRLSEMKEFVDLVRHYRRDFRSQFGLQINMSCPNVGRQPAPDFLNEVASLLEIAASLEIPLMPKLSVTTSTETAIEIAKLKDCDALCVSNTVPWGQLSDQINWSDLFGTIESPLKKYGGGGLSGAPLFSIVEKWVHEAVQIRKISKPINAGGGILCSDDVARLRRAGASSIFIGSAAFLRGWRVKNIIQKAHQVFEV